MRSYFAKISLAVAALAVATLLSPMPSYAASIGHVNRNVNYTYLYKYSYGDEREGGALYGCDTFYYTGYTNGRYHTTMDGTWISTATTSPGTC
jgi:hypothetical protein